jgi:outer membrane immunogenic protein
MPGLRAARQGLARICGGRGLACGLCEDGSDEPRLPAFYLQAVSFRFLFTVADLHYLWRAESLSLPIGKNKNNQGQGSDVCRTVGARCGVIGLIHLNGGPLDEAKFTGTLGAPGDGAGPDLLLRRAGANRIEPKCSGDTRRAQTRDRAPKGRKRGVARARSPLQGKYPAERTSVLERSDCAPGSASAASRGAADVAGIAANAAMPVYKAQPVIAAAAPWSGFYAGLGVGTRSAVADASVTSATTNFVGGSVTNLLIPPNCRNSPPGPCPGGEALDNTAFRLSPYLGYNWQFASQWLAGIEGDFGFASASRTLSGMYYPGGSLSLMPGSGDSSFSVKTGWDASIRARLGFLPTPTFMVYATGGPAWLHLEQMSNCPTTPFSFCKGGTIPVGNINVVAPTQGPASITDSTTRLGWTAGAGTEVLLGGNWIARAEYRYADFGTWSPTDVRTCIDGGTTGCGIVAQTVTDSVHVRTHTATFGLAYKFDWGGGAGPSNAYAQAAGPMFYKAAPVPVASWSGLYLGVGVGTRSSIVDGSVPSAFTSDGVRPGVNWTGLPTCGTGTGLQPPTPCPGGESFDNTAFRLSPYLGYNWQIGSKWLAGLEGDWGWANASRSLNGVWYPGGSPSFFQAQGDTSFSVKTTWDASIRARLGFLVTPTFQVYGTGGPAWIHLEQTSNCPTFQPSNFCGSGFAQPQLPLDNFTPASITKLDHPARLDGRRGHRDDALGQLDRPGGISLRRLRHVDEYQCSSMRFRTLRARQPDGHRQPAPANAHGNPWPGLQA